MPNISVPNSGQPNQASILAPNSPNRIFCSYCRVSDRSLVKCVHPDCQKYFCNNQQNLGKSHIYSHLLHSKHHQIALTPGPKLQCAECQNDNALELSLARLNNAVILLCSGSCLNKEKYQEYQRLALLIEKSQISSQVVKRSKKSTLKTIQFPTQQMIDELELSLGNTVPLPALADDLNLQNPIQGQKRSGKGLVQTKVKIMFCKNKGSRSAELDRTNEDHFKGMLIPGDMLIIKDENLRKWEAKAYVKQIISNEKIQVSLTKQGRDLNPLSTFKVQAIIGQPTASTKQEQLITSTFQGAETIETSNLQNEGRSDLYELTRRTRPQNHEEELPSHIKQQYESVNQYASNFKPLVKAEEESQYEACQDLTQLGVRVTVFEGNDMFYLDLNRSNDEHFRGTLKDEDELIIIDEMSNVKVRGYVDLKVKRENVRVCLGRKGRKLNPFSTFTVKTVFIDVPYKRAIEGLSKFKSDIGISKELKSIILGQTSYSDAVSLREDDLTMDLSELDKFNLNEFQTKAVKKALGPSPLVLIQGPPGTGKTTTMTASIMQFAKNIKKHHKILICAPSNLAVDNVTEELIENGLEDSIVRIYAVCKEKSERKPELNRVALHTMVQKEASAELKLLQAMRRNHEKMSKKKRFRLSILQLAVERAIIGRKKIICCTCITAGSLMLSEHFFKYVFIDEAAQATEPECLLPMLHHAEKVVLAGDHKQLGPIITNRQAQAAGLDHTMFERLMSKADSCMLKWQYRMHDTISTFPSDHFYGGELMTHPTVSRPINTKFPWPKNNIPLFFYHINGKEQRPRSGVSYFNREECLEVVRLIHRLVASGVELETIGIITPYNGQKALLLDMFERFQKKVDVASVDGFQGRQKDYIIISCVRSNEKGSVGFLNDRRRLNVALTRAKYGLIVCGNAQLLAHDDDWRSSLESYKRRGVLVEREFGEWRESHVNIRGKNL